jgi:hypothetical protein
MLLAMGSAVESGIVIAVVILVLWLATVAAVAVVTVRGVRRASRVARAWLHRGAAAGSGRPGIEALRATASATVGSPRWWLVQHDRHRMWRAVSAAQHAVEVARRSGAPVGDLPALTRELGQAAAGVDAVLRASARSATPPKEARTARAGIEETAAGLHRAAMESLTTVAESATDRVASATRVEVDALAAGLRAARAAAG